MADIYGMAMQGLEIADQGRERKKQKTLAGLLSQAYQQPDQRNALIGQAIGLDPAAGFAANQSFGAMDDQRKAKMVQHAQVFSSLPDEVKPQAYAQLAAEVRQLTGIPVPDQYDPKFLPMIQKMAGGQEAEQFTLAPGSARYDSTGRQIVSQPFAPANMQLANVATGDGGTQQMQYDPRGGALKPLNFGNPQEVQSAIQQLAGQFGGQISSMVRTPEHNREVGGVPNSQHIRGTAGDVVIGDPAMRKAYMEAAQGMGFSVLDEGDHLHTQLPRGAQIAQRGPLGYTPPKPDGGKAPPSGYRWSADGSQLEMIPGGPAAVAGEARDAANAAKADAAAIKEQAARTRQIESANTAGELVSAIDALTTSDGFKGLGTTMGDFQLNVPFIRNDVKDAQAQLKNVSGQVALATMSRLKALSAQGATGFGALSQQELRLLENSIATLQSDEISNDQLSASLKVIRDKMEKVSKWSEPSAAKKPMNKFAVGQVIEANGKKYRVTDVSDPDDPDVEEVP